MDAWPTPSVASPGAIWRSRISLAALCLGAAGMAATFFLISPPRNATFPGAIPWSPTSLLRPLVDALSLFGWYSTIRGVEIKEVAFHGAVAVGLLLLAARVLVAARWPSGRPPVRRSWFFAQTCLVAWVLLALLSALWAVDPSAAAGQATLYALALAWALVLAWTLESRDVARLVWLYALLAALAALLCGWYFHERNPAHRPGFPIGNPAGLAGCLMPAALAMAAVLLHALPAALRREPGAALRAGAAVLLLAALAWGLTLTASRGALLGLLAGVAGWTLLVAPARVRVGVLVALALGAAVGWLALTQTGAGDGWRSETIRFRMHAWRYAAILWGNRPFAGFGAGAYPALAGTLAAPDRALDPGAFPAELVEHAHNELFEVLTEIGLIGGLTFVAGYVATVLAAGELLRAPLTARRRWMLSGLVAGLLGAMADGMFGVGLRLEGVPAVFFTLLGLLWAACRGVGKTSASIIANEARAPSRWPLIAAGACVVGAVVGAGFAWRSARAAAADFSALEAARSGDFERAIRMAEPAPGALLDPVRRIESAGRLVRHRLDLARSRAAELQSLFAQTSQPARLQADAALSAALNAAESAYDAALTLQQRAPAYVKLLAERAAAAELLVELCRLRDPQRAADWYAQAWTAWRLLREARPYDPVALLALTRYPMLVGDYVGLLRDWLRNGLPTPAWFDALQRGQTAPGFDKAIDAMSQAARPFNAQTDRDALVLSSAPEMLRLSAVRAAQRGEFSAAATDAARAAELYRAMRARYPGLDAVALAEQAEYLFRNDATAAPECAALVQAALDALPRIQTQKREDLARPFEWRLARYLLAAGREPQAREALQRAGVSDIEAALQRLRQPPTIEAER